MKAASKTSGASAGENRKSKTKSSEARSQKTQTASANREAQDADELLKADHRKVEGLFEKFEQAGSGQEKQKLAQQICQELIIHTLLEEEIFYPACRNGKVEAETMDEAQVEHDGAKLLINELLHEEAGSDMYDAKVKVLAEYIKHHVGEEEKTSDGIFASARREGVDMKALGRRVAQRKEQLLAEAEQDSLPPPMPRSLHIQTLGSSTDGRRNKENGDMNRYQGNNRDRDRDERNRFEQDDQRGGGYSSRSRGQQDDNDRDDRGRQGGWSREYQDYQGGSMSERGRYGSQYGGGQENGNRGNGDRQYGNRDQGERERGESGWSRGAGGLGRSMGAGSMAYRGGSGSSSQNYGSSENYGSQGYGSQGSGSQGYGSQDYGSQRHGSQDYGTQGYSYQGENRGGERDWSRGQEGGRSFGGGSSGGDYGQGRGGLSGRDQDWNRGGSQQGRNAQGQRDWEHQSEWDRDDNNNNGGQRGRSGGSSGEDYGSRDSNRSWRNRD